MYEESGGAKRSMLDANGPFNFLLYPCAHSINHKSPFYSHFYSELAPPVLLFSSTGATKIFLHKNLWGKHNKHLWLWDMDPLGTQIPQKVTGFNSKL